MSKGRHFFRILIPCILFVTVSLSSTPNEGWIPLFNGRDLSGWRAAEHPSSFKVEDGAIVAHGPRAHLFYIGEGEAFFRDFELTCEVKLWPGANSGIYFHTEYQPSGWPSRGLEIQLNNSQKEHEGYYEFKKTGSLYGVRNVLKVLVPDGVWFHLRVRVQDNHVEVWIEGVKVVDFIGLADRDEAVLSRMGGGTFALQAHDPESRAAFRNLWVRNLSTALSKGVRRQQYLDRRTYQRLLLLYRQNYPIADLHAHLKGGLTVEDILDRFYQTGINYGIAVNCGYGFSITNDAGLYRWLEQMQGLPVFLGMQAEGREWIDLFSPEAVARFDYVFTDALTYVDRNGKRVRLWIDEEVDVSDPERFMEEYVDRIVQIISTEPIDVFVNPTFLPRAIADRYDELWTEERMLRIIKAAAKHGVAIEINDRYRIPSAKFIRLAKEHGVLFTLGTNNGGKDDLGTLSYGLRMIEECGLQPSDFFVPGRRPSRIQRLVQKERLAAVNKALVYVGTYTGGSSKGIYGWLAEFQPQKLEGLGCVAEVPNPSFLVVNREGTRLYAVSEAYGRGGERGAGRLYGYAVDQRTGRLTLIGSVPTGGHGPCHLCLSPDERAVVVANYGDGSVGLIALDEEGRPTKLTDVARHQGFGPNRQRQEGPHAHCATPTPDGRYILVADLGVDRVYVYRIHRTGAGDLALVHEAQLDVTLPPGSGPRHVAFHPHRNLLYVVNELMSTVAVYRYEPVESRFEWLQTISCLPAGFDGQNTAAEVAVDPTGKWLLVSNRGHDSIAVMRLLIDGTLAPWRYVPCGGRRPRHFAFTPDGAQVWVANQGSDEIAVFEFDSLHGALVDTGQRLRVGSPACTVFIPLVTGR